MGDLRQPWEQTVAQKRTIRDRQLAPYLVDDLERRVPRVYRVDERSRLEDPEAQRITDIDGVEDLVRALQKGKLTAEQVIKAYIQR